jgi:hypothetical protein
LVLSTGDADDGVRDKLDLTSDFMASVRELLTVCPLITIVIVRDWPALTLVSRAPVRQTKAEVVEDWAIHSVY